MPTSTVSPKGSPVGLRPRRGAAARLVYAVSLALGSVILVGSIAAQLFVPTRLACPGAPDAAARFCTAEIMLLQRELDESMQRYAWPVDAAGCDADGQTPWPAKRMLWQRHWQSVRDVCETSGLAVEHLEALAQLERQGFSTLETLWKLRAQSACTLDRRLRAAR